MSIQSEKVTVDHDVQSIVALDRQKKLIRFSDELGEFKELSQGELNQLSERAQTSWRLAKEAYDARKEEEKAPDIEEWKRRVTVGVQRGQARTRLKIMNKQKGWAYKWQAPQDVWVKENQFGWQKVEGGPERTLANQSGVGPHVIGDRGSEELVLMRRPIEVQKAWEQAQTEKNNARAGAISDNYRETIERQGYKTVGVEDEGKSNKGRSSEVVLSGDQKE